MTKIAAYPAPFGEGGVALETVKEKLREVVTGDE